MRVTEKTKQETRRRILVAAKQLFVSQGFSETATRDISKAAGVAAGTLFNYFPTKESIVLVLARDCSEAALAEFWKRRREDATLEEDIFALIAAHLRKLRTLRKYLEPVLETLLHPAAQCESAESMRACYFEVLHAVLRLHGNEAALSTVAAQLHWSLFAGVLSFWCTDRSPKQEDSLALLDQSIQMFLNWFEANAESG